MKDAAEFVKWMEEFVRSGTPEISGRERFWKTGFFDEINGYGRIEGICGDTMEIFLRIEDGRVSEARFETDGCVSSQMCGAAVAWLAEGEKLIDALAVSPADIIRLYSRFDGVDNHCAILATSTLYRAIADYILTKRENIAI